MNSTLRLIAFRRKFPGNLFRLIERSFHSLQPANDNKTASPTKTQLPPRPTLSPSETTHKFTKGSGPGGQKINKSTSAAQVTHVSTGIVVKSQRTRSRTQNLKIAERILAERIDALEKGGDSRREKVRDRKRKKKASAEKKSKRKYRALAGDKDGETRAHDVAGEEGLEKDLETDGVAGKTTTGAETGAGLVKSLVAKERATGDPVM